MARARATTARRRPRGSRAAIKQLTLWREPSVLLVQSEADQKRVQAAEPTSSSIRHERSLGLPALNCTSNTTGRQLCAEFDGDFLHDDMAFVRGDLDARDGASDAAPFG